jgi:hypothetical protein
MNIEAIDENIIDLQLQEMSLALARRKISWNISRPYLGPITNALQKLKLEPSIDSSGDYNIHASGDKQMLVALMRILRISGFNSNGDRPKKGESTWCAWFEHPACKMRIWLNFSSTVCKQVQIGSKTVTYEQPIYETRCVEDLQEVPPCETALILETESTPALTNQEA